MFDEDHYRRFMITVRHNGSVRWQPGGVYIISCALNMLFYPFDDQRCTMELETWVYTADKVNLTIDHTDVDLSTYVENGEWMITKHSVRSEHMVSKTTSRLSFPILTCRQRRVGAEQNIGSEVRGLQQELELSKNSK